LQCYLIAEPWWNDIFLTTAIGNLWKNAAGAAKVKFWRPSAVNKTWVLSAVLNSWVLHFTLLLFFQVFHVSYINFWYQTLCYFVLDKTYICLCVVIWISAIASACCVSVLFWPWTIASPIRNPIIELNRKSNWIKK
jgi:hypothetical protein